MCSCHHHRSGIIISWQQYVLVFLTMFANHLHKTLFIDYYEYLNSYRYNHLFQRVIGFCQVFERATKLLKHWFYYWILHKSYKLQRIRMFSIFSSKKFNFFTATYINNGLWPWKIYILKYNRTALSTYHRNSIKLRSHKIPLVNVHFYCCSSILFRVETTQQISDQIRERAIRFLDCYK